MRLPKRRFCFQAVPRPIPLRRKGEGYVVVCCDAVCVVWTDRRSFLTEHLPHPLPSAIEFCVGPINGGAAGRCPQVSRSYFDLVFPLRGYRCQCVVSHAGAAPASPG